MAVVEDLNWKPWLIAAQNGDQVAYAKFLQGITPLLRNFIAKRLFNQDLVEDTLQETLLGIHKMRATYNAENPLLPWIFAIARYKVIDAIRKQSRKAEQEMASLDDENLGLSETIGDMHTKTDAGDVRKDLNAALHNLPVQQREIVTLLKVKGDSVAMVAARLDMSTSAVKVSAHRAYKKMRKFLETQ